MATIHSDHFLWVMLGHTMGDTFLLESQQKILDFSVPWYERLELIKENDDIEILGKALQESPEPEIRTAIVHQIEDQNLLSQVCYNDEDPAVRNHAASKITDDSAEVLVHLIKNDSDHNVRKTAVVKLHAGFQKLLHRVMIHDTHTEVRRKAIKKLRLDLLQDSELADLCIAGQEPLVRKGALYQLDNEDELLRVALNGEDYKIIEMAIDKIENIEYLKTIAQEAEFAHGRYCAIYNLEDQEFISNICIQDSNIEVQKSCIEKIDNVELLAKLRFEADPKVHYLIKEKIRRLDNSLSN